MAKIKRSSVRFRALRFRIKPIGSGSDGFKAGSKIWNNGNIISGDI